MVLATSSPFTHLEDISINSRAERDSFCALPVCIQVERSLCYEKERTGPGA